MSFRLGELLGSEEIHVRLECATGKTPFDSRQDANRALKRLPRSGPTRMTVFRCGYCEKYHLGHRRGAVL